MPKNLIRSLAIAAVFSAGVYTADVMQKPIEVHASSTQIDGYDYSAEVVEAFNEINRIRQSAGLQPYKIDPFLSKSAESHAKYLTTHVKDGSHYQTAGKSGFTGRDYEERAKSAGYTITSGAEAIAYGGSTKKSLVNQLVEAIFHRNVLLNAGYDTVGIGVDGSALVIVTDDTDRQSTGSVAYPYNGQKDAPTLFDVNEEPDPLAKYGVRTSGYMISYNPKETLGWFGGHKMTLKDSKGNLVPLYNKDNEPDKSINQLYIVPKNELKHGETYKVDVTYTDIDDQKHSYSWSFTTAGTQTQQPPTTPTQPPTKDLSQYSKRFGDFDPKQWWAEDMAWAVDKGIISGYGNTWNPKTKKYETHLKPNNQLTEAHFLMIFFRFAAPVEYENLQPTSKWLFNKPYQLAKRYNMPTLANESSETKKKLADGGIRRGKLAQLLISFHERKQVTETYAINFMISEGLTAAKTIKDYNANQILTRGQISAFLQRYEEMYMK